MEGRKQQKDTIRYFACVRTALVTVATATMFTCVAAFGTAQAQSTAGRIFGSAPAGAVVSVQSNSGTHRHTTVRDSGRYSLRALPLGVYTVTLKKGGKVADMVPLSAGRGMEVDFACPHDQCAAPHSP